MAIFIPVALLSCFLIPLARLRLFVLVVSGTISLYYTYKETKEYIIKYLNDEQTLKYVAAY